MRIDLSKKDVIWSYIGTIMSMASNLIVLPFVLYYLDDNMYGLWGIFASLGAIATLFDCGFSVTFARNITYCWSGAKELKRENVSFTESVDPDYRLMKLVLITCKKIYLIISLAAAVLLFLIGTPYIMSVSKDVQGSTPIIGWLIYAFAAILNLYYGYYASFLRGVGAVDQANINTVVSRIVQILLTLALLFLGMGLVGTSIAYLAYGTIFRILGKRKFYKYQNIGNNLDAIDYRPDRKEQNELFAIVWHNAWRDGIISVCNYLCNQATTIICSMYLSLAQTGMYSLGVQITSAIAQIAGALYTSYQPSLQEAYITKNIDKMRKTMALIVSTYILLFLAGTCGVVYIGLPLLRIIKPGLNITLPILLGLCIFQFMMKFRNCYTSYFSCTNRILYLKGFIISSVLTVLFSFVFTGYMGLELWGLILAQIISQAIYNVWYWPYLAHKELETSLIDILKIGFTQLFNIIQRRKLK